MTTSVYRVVATLTAVLGGTLAASSMQYTISIPGSASIFLAGRTDLTIPAASDPWTGPGDYLIRHGGPTPEEIQETLPPWISVAGGDVIKVADPAVGGVNFFQGFGPPFFGPSGNGLSGSNLGSLGGISGYKGPQGPLAGVFLDANLPIGAAPGTLDFSPAGLGIDFLNLYPSLGQVFYVGDGVTGGGDYHQFHAPVGASRLFLGIPDGFGFVGAPGAYDDNDGSYRVKIGVNADPNKVPDGGSALGLLLLALAPVAARRSRVQSIL